MTDDAGFILFGLDADFSLAVFERMIQLNQLPIAIVVPEYPPGQAHSTELIHLSVKKPKNPLIKNAESLDLDIIYAPEAFQSALEEQLSAITFDFILVACWPYRLSEAVCRLARKASMNLHPSLLPNYRGANPIDEQLASDDRDFGVSLHLLDQQFDSGDIVKQTLLDITNIGTNRREIEGQAASLGVELFIQAMKDFGSSSWKPIKQIIN